MGTNQRSQIEMTDEEIATFIDQSRTATRATIGTSGMPHPVAMWYGASFAFALFATAYEVLAAALGLKGLIGSVNSVTAALGSSLMAALAIGVFSLYYSNKLVVKLSNEEREKIKQWAEAQELIAKQLEDFFFGENAAMPPGYVAPK